MKKIARSHELPKWFDLKKYDVVADASLLDWSLNVFIRSEIIREVESAAFKTEGKISGSGAENIALIQEHGFLGRHYMAGEYEIAKTDFNLDKFRPGFGIVYPLPMWRAVDIYESIQLHTELRHNLELISYQKVFHHRRDEPLSRKENDLKDWYANYYMGTSYDEVFEDFGEFSPHLCVDLGVTDEKLIEGFKDWLQSIRKNNKIDILDLPGRLSSSLVKKWKDAAILPYLDLKIYENLEGRTYPLHIIGNAIFPTATEIDTTEAVRKTTRRHADMALKQVHGILRQALIEEEKERNGMIPR